MRGKGPLPAEFLWVVMMDRVGGYLSFLALLEDHRRYRDLLIVMEAEGDAQKLSALETKFKATAGGRRR